MLYPKTFSWNNNSFNKNYLYGRLVQQFPQVKAKCRIAQNNAFTQFQMCLDKKQTLTKIWFPFISISALSKNVFLPNIYARRYKLQKEKIYLLCTWKVHKKVISAIASIKSRFESLHKHDRQILKLRLSLVFNMKMCTKIMFYGWKLVFFVH